MSGLVIDVSRLVRRRLAGRIATGVDRVGLEYVRHFGPRATALVSLGGHWVLLSKPASDHLFDELLVGCAGRASLLSHVIRGARVGRLGRRPVKGSWLLNTGHSGLESSAYAQWVFRLQLNPIYFVHDLIPLTHPEYCRPGEAVRHHQRMLTVARSGKGVIVNSQSTLADLERFARLQGLQLPPCTVAHLAPATLPDGRAGGPPISEPYFVILGTIEPRKNHWMMLQVWRTLAARSGAKVPRLVIIGRRGWESENVFDLLDRSEVLRPYLVELPRCGDAELAAWLANAQAVLFPSFKEGYGMPLMEALALGVPVIASDLPVFREIAGSIPEYVDPIDGAMWMKKITDYAHSASAARLAQLERIGKFRIPTWHDHFLAVEELMERVMRREVQ